jgi:hypothetical protein
MNLFCNDMMFLSLLASIVSLACAATPGVDVDVQILFNSSGTQYPTDFTRDIVPVKSPPFVITNDVFRRGFTRTTTTGGMFHSTLPYHMGLFPLKPMYGS